MRNISIVITIVILLSNTSSCQVSVLDRYIGPYRILRKAIAAAADAAPANKPFAHKIQSAVPLATPFPCNTNNTRSSIKPNSVHRLRPGDIDVIGGLGDSLSVGCGLFAPSPLFLVVESRGASFSMGGDSTWREYITIPNILKVFNPNLIGYSVGNSLTIQEGSQFNVAEIGAVSGDTPYMASVLVKRILNDPRVDAKNDWKLITYLIGHNDFCSKICLMQNPENALIKHRQDLLSVLRMLRENLPRTIVNLILPINTYVLKQITSKPNECHVFNLMECACVFALAHQAKSKLYNNLAKKWQEIDVEIANYEEFSRPDFAVVVQPFTLDITFENDTTGNTDLSILSADCFHFSQKGNAAFANSLWNTMMQPVGAKNLSPNTGILKTFLCPTETNPYIFTKENSKPKDFQ